MAVCFMDTVVELSLFHADKLSKMGKNLRKVGLASLRGMLKNHPSTLIYPDGGVCYAIEKRVLNISYLKTMKILKNAGSFQILTPKVELKEQLRRIELAGRTCYQSFKGKITNESASNFIKMIISRGHFSVIEHSSLTVRFINISRGFTHELVRHRLCSFSQESTRYVDYAKRGDTKFSLEKFQVSVVSPPHQDEKKKVALEDGRKMSFVEMAEEIEKFYRALRKAGWPSEDARQILPIGLRSEIVVTANFREWLHIMYLRTSKFAHWEIRSVMIELLKELKRLLPPIFATFKIKGKDSNGILYAESSMVF